MNCKTVKPDKIIPKNRHQKPSDAPILLPFEDLISTQKKDKPYPNNQLFISISPANVIPALSVVFYSPNESVERIFIFLSLLLSEFVSVGRTIFSVTQIGSLDKTHLNILAHY
jgi:hypothetical protein